MPLYVIVMMFKSCYYPLKDIFGEFFCHVFASYEVFSVMTTQFHTFFVTLFRYICIFHDDNVVQMKITARVTMIMIIST